jgi:hypothetical protein
VPVLDKRAFLALAREVVAESKHRLGNLEGLLSFAFDYPFLLNKKRGIQFSPALPVSQLRVYLSALLKSHFDKRCQRVSIQPVSTVPDPAVDVVLEATSGIPKQRLREASELHRLSMAAENKVGELLEVYLATALEPDGWLWCCGNLIQGVDFFRVGKSTELLQIKNRSNSENSSSSRIRELIETKGCPVAITPWYRIEASSGATCWEKLPGNSRMALADEARFQQFLREYLAKPVVISAKAHP